MDENMIKLYLDKRAEYESKIKNDLEKIEVLLVEFAQDGDYFSIQASDESIITFTAKNIDDKLSVLVHTNENLEDIPLTNLRLTEHPDLIKWIIQNDKFIKEGFMQVLINAVRNGEDIITSLRAMKVNYE